MGRQSWNPSRKHPGCERPYIMAQSDTPKPSINDIMYLRSGESRPAQAFSHASTPPDEYQLHQSPPSTAQPSPPSSQTSSALSAPSVPSAPPTSSPSSSSSYSAAPAHQNAHSATPSPHARPPSYSASYSSSSPPAGLLTAHAHTHDTLRPGASRLARMWC